MKPQPEQAEFIPAHLSPYLDVVRTLFLEYRAEVDAEACFQTFEAELDSLPGRYAPPEGVLVLVEWEGNPAACAALRPLSDGACELKRVYVRPAYRGKQLGKLLVERFIERAKVLGYSEIRLNTLPTMTSAIALYESLGFQAIEPPLTADSTPALLYFEKTLAEITS
ncbi:MAG: GNAT family N-acetyltransferase [Rhodothermales bacterium]|nr:GNAT family N-acetyltransferase [Rhodothermales bacterium]